MCRQEIQQRLVERFSPGFVKHAMARAAEAEVNGLVPRQGKLFRHFFRVDHRHPRVLFTMNDQDLRGNLGGMIYG